MFNHGLGNREDARAIWALVIKPLTDKLFIFFAVNFNCPVLANPTTHFVKTHADQLIRHVRLGPPRSRPQLGDWVVQLCSFPRSQSTSTPNTCARALSS